MRQCDLIIIGGGPAGLSAGLYASRAKVNTVLLEKTFAGGQIATTGFVENYPGVKKISGMELAMTMEEQAKEFGLKVELCEVESIKKVEDIFHVESSCVNFQAPAIILTTGVRPRKINVPGEKEYKGRGISYCAICDGFFYNGKHVAVIGGGNSAVEEGIYLTKFADKVSIIHRRDELRAQKVIQDRAFENPKIEFIWNTVVKEVQGNGEFVTGLKLENIATGEVTDMPVDGVFVYIGTEPNLFITNLDLHSDEMGFIVTDVRMHTSEPGIFAAGDVRVKTLRQVVTAVADGAIAAVAAEEYIDELRRKHQALKKASMLNDTAITPVSSEKYLQEMEKAIP